MKHLSLCMSIAFASVVILITGCATTELAPPVDADGDTSICPEGTLGCPCDANDECSGDLVCVNDVCTRGVSDGDDDGVETDGDVTDKDVIDEDIDLIEVESDGDVVDDDTVETDTDEEAETGPCTPGDLRCSADAMAVEECMNNGKWKTVEECTCGMCEDNKCIRALCPYEFDSCKDDTTVILSADDDACCPPMEEPCAQDYVCDETAGACVPIAVDGDVDTVDQVDQVDEDQDSPCDDGNPCTHDFMEFGECRHSTIGCEQDGNPCTNDVCDPADGQCKPEFVPDGRCDQNDNPCSMHVCSDVTMACSERPDPQGSCDDGDLCNGEEYCDGLECQSSDPVECTPCYSCDPDSGQCYCDGSCEYEECNGIDDNCDGRIDENNVCNPGSGLRIEMSWTNLLSDVDLHVLRPGGVFGTNNQVDPNDCYFNNQNPDWGVAGDPDDNPYYPVDETQGRGEDNRPESVTVAFPSPEPYRVLAHYSRFSGIQGALDNSTIYVKVYFDDVLVASESATLPGANMFWNVFCIKYFDGEVTLIQNEAGENEVESSIENINAHACMSAGQSCNSPCDCPQGLACVNDVCEDTGTPAYCCDTFGCPAGNECYSGVYDSWGMCGFRADFDKDPQGADIEAYDSIIGVYNPWGVRFSTSRTGATVIADEWELESDSGNNSCGTLDPNGDRWLGTIWVEFMTPGSSPGNITKLGTYDVSFYVGETHVNYGLRVQALNAANDLIYEAYVDTSTQMVIHTEQPISRMRIEPNNDPNFVIDDVQVPLLLHLP